MDMVDGRTLAECPGGCAEATVVIPTDEELRRRYVESYTEMMLNVLKTRTTDGKLVLDHGDE